MSDEPTDIGTGYSGGKRPTSANLTPWPKGVSGNPSGRPKGYSDFAKICREHASGPALQALMDNLTCLEPSARNNAAALILAYAWGKPGPMVTVEERDKAITLMTESERLAKIKEIMDRDVKEDH